MQGHSTTKRARKIIFCLYKINVTRGLSTSSYGELAVAPRTAHTLSKGLSLSLSFFHSERKRKAIGASEKRELDLFPAAGGFGTALVAIMASSVERTRERESSLGIRCFMAEGKTAEGAAIPEIGGIFKHRFTDFVVREVDLDGNIATLTELKSKQGEPSRRDGAEEGAEGGSSEAAPASEEKWLDHGQEGQPNG